MIITGKDAREYWQKIIHTFHKLIHMKGYEHFLKAPSKRYKIIQTRNTKRWTFLKDVVVKGGPSRSLGEYYYSYNNILKHNKILNVDYFNIADSVFSDLDWLVEDKLDFRNKFTYTIQRAVDNDLDQVHNITYLLVVLNFSVIENLIGPGGVLDIMQSQQQIPLLKHARRHLKELKEFYKKNPKWSDKLMKRKHDTEWLDHVEKELGVWITNLNVRYMIRK